jgi:uncharacterized membrane protein YphA (DoxX/SURF4 family)
MLPAVQQVSEPPGPDPPSWNFLKRLTFRFVCPYLVLYHLDWILQAIAGKTIDQFLYRQPMRALSAWVAIHVFHQPATLSLGWGGNRDTTLYYIHNLDLLMIAAVTAIVWSLLDRKRRENRALHSWVRLLVRYSLASSLLTYGFSKVFVVQMAPLWLFPSRLIEPFGDQSPAGLLWAFMGYSVPYQIFGGAAEVVPGLLLLFRRTTTLGSLMAAAVLANVVMLNLSYDVNIKLFSSNLLIAAVFLAAPDLEKLTRFFVFHQRVEPPDASGPEFQQRWLRIAAIGAKVVILALFLYESISTNYQSSLLRPRADRPVLYGLYDVELFARNGNELSPLTTDTERWKRVIIDYPPEQMQVQMMDESFRPYKVEYDKMGKSIVVSLGQGKAKKFVLECSRPDQDHVLVQGKLADATLTMRLKRIDVSKFLLLNRGFHWIQGFGLYR